MPKRKLELPAEITKAYPPILCPVRIATNRLEHPSPLEEYPGTIITPMSLSAPDYHDWWTQAGDGQPEDDPRHWAFFEWETRFHMIKKWDLQTKDGDHLDADVLKKNPADLPDMRIISWVVAITGPILSFSASLPNLPRPLNGTPTQNEQPKTAN